MACGPTRLGRSRQILAPVAFGLHSDPQLSSAAGSAVIGATSSTSTDARLLDQDRRSLSVLDPTLGRHRLRLPPSVSGRARPLPASSGSSLASSVSVSSCSSDSSEPTLVRRRLRLRRRHPPRRTAPSAPALTTSTGRSLLAVLTGGDRAGAAASVQVQARPAAQPYSLSRFRRRLIRSDAVSPGRPYPPPCVLAHAPGHASRPRPGAGRRHELP